jgi:hypothetical protein
MYEHIFNYNINTWSWSHICLIVVVLTVIRNTPLSIREGWLYKKVRFDLIFIRDRFPSHCGWMTHRSSDLTDRSWWSRLPLFSLNKLNELLESLFFNTRLRVWFQNNCPPALKSVNGCPKFILDTGLVTDMNLQVPDLHPHLTWILCISFLCNFWKLRSVPLQSIVQGTCGVRLKKFYVK